MIARALRVLLGHAPRRQAQMPCRDAKPLLEAGQPILGRPQDRREPCWRCSACGYIFFDAPDPQWLENYYQQAYARSASTWYTVENTYSAEHTGWLTALALAYANRFLGTDQVLYHETGCAFGAGVAGLRALGHDATGCELNKDAVALGRARGNAWISDEGDAAFLARTGRRPNIAYSNHVVEHMPDPLNWLRGLRPLLAERSIVVFAVPNAIAAAALRYGYYQYPWFDWPGHLHLYSPRSLLCLAAAAGYEVLHAETFGAAATPEASQAMGDPVPILRDMMGAELRGVLTPAGGPLSQQFRKDIAATREACLASGRRERMALADYARSPRPAT